MNTQSINLRNQIRKKYKSEQSFFRCLSSWSQGMQIAFFLEAVFSSSFKSFIQALLLLVFFLSCFQCAVPTIYNNVPDQTFVDFLPRHLLVSRFKSERYKGGILFCAVYSPYRLTLTL
jgi:hypothetical protein